MNVSMVNGIAELIRRSPSPYHVPAVIRGMLLQSGFSEKKETEVWSLAPGGSYFTVRNGSSILSFRMPEKEIRAFYIIASHGDSPTFQIKPDPETESEGLIRLNVEKYGGMLCSTWFDRPLGIAGRILFRDGDAVRETLIAPDKDLLMIPSLAIHMRRGEEKNASGDGINVQKEMLPVFAQESAEGDGHAFLRLIASEAGCRREDLLGTDISLVCRSRASVWGENGEFFSSPKLDDLACCYTSLDGFLRAAPREHVCLVHAVFNNEEVGSRTRQGAESTFLADVIGRIAECAGMSHQERCAAIAGSMMVSADNAHAVHPNYPEKADPVCRPRLNGGIVLKYHAGQKYTTDAVSAACFRMICDRHGIPYQTFVNRSDMQGGSTLGNIANTQVSLSTVDIGLPQLAMHSAYETCGTADLSAMADFAAWFYQEELPEIRS